MKKNNITAGVSILFLGILLASSVAAQETNEDDAEIDVTISAETAVDLDPDTLTYEGVSPGSVHRDTTTDPAIDAVQIENVGSSDIDQVWLSATEPLEGTPFGTGVGDNYDTANFVTVSLDSDYLDEEFGATDDGLRASFSDYTDLPTFVNRRDYAEHRDLSYVFVPEDGEWEYGRFRVAGEEYFWAVDTTTDGTPTDDFRVGQEAHTQFETGTSDFTEDNSENWEAYDLESIAEAEFFTASIEVPRDGENWGDDFDATVDWTDPRELEVVVQTDPTYTENSEETGVFTTRTKFNPEYDEFDLGEGNAEYLFDSDRTADAEVLNPGGSFQVATDLKVPRGVPEDPSNGLLTVNVRSN